MSGPVATVYATFPAGFDVVALMRALVEERLIACANILGAATSVYAWEGRTHADAEIAVLMKTAAARVQPLLSRLAAAHPYDVPCITVWPVSDGLPAYLDWVTTQTD
ncbi:divalent-cation tolerance protein CutA [Parapedomonas caeni]